MGFPRGILIDPCGWQPRPPGPESSSPPTPLFPLGRWLRAAEDFRGGPGGRTPTSRSLLLEFLDDSPPGAGHVTFLHGVPEHAVQRVLRRLPHAVGRAAGKAGKGHFHAAGGTGAAAPLMAVGAEAAVAIGVVRQHELEAELVLVGCDRLAETAGAESDSGAGYAPARTAERQRIEAAAASEKNSFMWAVYPDGQNPRHQAKGHLRPRQPTPAGTCQRPCRRLGPASAVLDFRRGAGPVSDRHHARSCFVPCRHRAVPAE